MYFKADIVASHIYSVVAIVTDDEGRYLVVSRKGDHDDLGWPGGKVNPGETAELAIIRELFEETGLLVSQRFLRSTFIAADQEGRLCMAFDILQYKGVAYSRKGAWVGWVKAARLVTERNAFRDYNIAVFNQKGIAFDGPPEPPPPPEPSVEEKLLELTGTRGFPQRHITFLHGPSALSFCPVVSIPQPRLTFDRKCFVGLSNEPVLGIRAHLQKSLIPLNLLRYMHSLGDRCIAAVVAVCPHRPPADWEAVSSNIIECQPLQIEVKLTLTKNRAATTPIGSSVIVSRPARSETTTSFHQPLP